MLPTEILTCIFQELRGPRRSGPYNSLEYSDYRKPGEDAGLPTLTQLALCSKAFNNIATPILYQYLDVSLDAPSRFHPMMATIMAREELGEHVVKIRVTISPSLARMNSVASAKCVETLLKHSKKVEQIVLIGLNVRSISNAELDADLEDFWTKALRRPLLSCRRLQALTIISGNLPFTLPDFFRSLKYLRIDHPSPVLALCTFAPMLTTLSISAKDDHFPEETYWEHLSEHLTHIQHLHFANSYCPPPRIAKILQLSPNLRVFKWFTWLPSITGGSIPNLPEVKPDAYASIIERMEISITFQKELGVCISEQMVEALRQLLFDYRCCSVIEVDLYGIAMTSHGRGNLLSHLRNEWQSEGTTVLVRIADID